jgi:hypothetical protein
LSKRRDDMPSRSTKESVYEETRKRGSKGYAPRSKEKISFLEELSRDGKIKKIGKKYYLLEFAPGPEEIRRPIYREVQKAGQKGKTYTSKEKGFICEELARDGRIKKVGKKYYLSELVPDPPLVIAKIREAGEDGVSLSPIESEVLKVSKDKKRVRKIGDKHYYERFGPLKQKEVIKRLLDDGRLVRSGKNSYVFVKGTVSPRLYPVEVPSFLEFAKKVQDVYLSMAGDYRRSINIRSLIGELGQRMGISEPLAEKWIVELPRIFLGRVDLRPFPGEEGLKLDDGSEVARIYLERGLVGL